MNRIAFLAAAAALIALPASAQSIRVSTDGKSAGQVRNEVFQAARAVCAREVPGYAYRVEEGRACVARAVRTTLAQSQDPSLRVATR